MEKEQNPTMTPVPRVYQAIGKGCGLAANNAYLLMIPFVIDLLLLFGPKLRVNGLFQPLFDAAIGQMRMNISNAGSAQLDTLSELMSEFLASVNLFGFIQTFPVGISVMFSSAGETTPLGKASAIQISKTWQIIPAVILMSILGVLIGTVYFSLTAAKSAEDDRKHSFSGLGKQILNIILLYLVLAAAVVILAVPFSCIYSLAFMTAPIVYQIVMILMIMLGCWMLIPVYFTTHGIFMCHYDFPEAFKQSFRMMPWAGTFAIRYLLYTVIITFGMDMIWSIPSQGSWLILFSIFGHAFISTALLAGSFYLFKDLSQWGKDNRQFLSKLRSGSRYSQLFKKESENND